MNSADITEDRWQEYMRDKEELWVFYQAKRKGERYDH